MPTDRQTATSTRCLCDEMGLLGLHETPCAGFGSLSDELCEQAERDASAAGSWPEPTTAASARKSARCAVCHGVQHVRKNGTFGKHHLWQGSTYMGVCPGYNRTPEEVERAPY